MNIKRSSLYWTFIKKFAVNQKLIILYFQIVFIIAITTIISVVRPSYQGELIDNLSNINFIQKNEFITQLFGFLALLLVSYIITYIQKYISTKISEEIAENLRSKINHKLEIVDSNFFMQTNLSDIVMKMDKDVSAIKQSGVTSLINLLSNLIILLAVIPFMYNINKFITISNVLLILFIPIVSNLIGSKIQKASRKVLNNYEELTNIINDNFSNWFIIRLFNCAKFSRDKFESKNTSYKKSINKQNYLYIVNSTMALILQFLGTCIIWVVGAYEILNGNMTIGIVMALMNYQSIITSPIIGIASFFNDFNTSLESLKDLFSLLDFEDAKQGEIKLEQAPNKIELCNISYQYNKSELRVLNNINMQFFKGSIYSVIGKSGEGKSTLFKIIAGILKPTHGTVLVDGMDLNDIDKISYWKHMGYVLQRSKLFQDTIWNNLNIGKLNQINRIEDVCESLDIMDLINSLNSKWDTIITAEGSNFSEGQLRRLDIARTLLKNPSMVLMDEVTSNIDPNCKEKIWEIIREQKQNCIILMSTHDQKEMQIADTIYKITTGGVINEGWSD